MKPKKVRRARKSTNITIDAFLKSKGKEYAKDDGMTFSRWLEKFIREEKAKRDKNTGK